MLERERSEVRVVDEDAADADVLEHPSQDGRVVGCRLDDDGRAGCEPRVDPVERLIDGQRSRKQPRLGHQPDEREQCDPGERDRVLARQRTVEPTTGRLMTFRIVLTA
jgi:hypothetical protein